MSKAHARLERHGASWRLVDLGAKNGCFINGRASSVATLRDGDVFELGGTAFVFRDGPWLAEAGPGAEDDLRMPTPELGTFHAELARDVAAAATIARARTPVLIGGETGTGKEIVARAIHELSQRSGPFVAVNCGALPGNLVEAQLFGHRKGAFSGALNDEPGLVRASDGGTLLLDEVGELPESSQAALLRVLQEGEVLPVGSSRPVKVDLRVVAATNRDLGALVHAGRFRADLHARLRGFEIHLPPLRARREDLGMLVRRLLMRLLGERDAAQVTFKALAARALMLYDWPYNVRELLRTLEQAHALSKGGPIELDHLPEAVRAAASGEASSSRPVTTQVPVELSARDALHRALHIDRSDDELRKILELQLIAQGGNINAVARELGKDPKQIRRWVERFDLDPDAFRR
jgi:transcriptional regulator with GAF, ATPase, and Fis domain